MDELDARAAILVECEQQGLSLLTQQAYVLATVEHETNNTWLPVREAYWLSEDWRRKNLRYYPYYGRGYVQITWRTNYEKFGKILGIPLAEEPDLALQQDYARIILVHGFVQGLFTGKSLSMYVNSRQTDFVGARRCINGIDRAQHIADIANRWLTILEKNRKNL